MSPDLSVRMLSLAAAARSLQTSPTLVRVIRDAQQVADIAEQGGDPTGRPLIDMPPVSVDTYA